MKKSKNSEQPISNQIDIDTDSGEDIVSLEFPECVAIIQFLENQLGLGPLSSEAKYDLCQHIMLGIDAYQKDENITPYDRGKFIKTLLESAKRFRENISCLIADSQLAHRSFSQNFDINRMMRLQQEVSELVESVEPVLGTVS